LLTLAPDIVLGDELLEGTKKWSATSEGAHIWLSSTSSSAVSAVVADPRGAPPVLPSGALTVQASLVVLAPAQQPADALGRHAGTSSSSSSS
jgi:hypothetical protein